MIKLVLLGVGICLALSGCYSWPRSCSPVAPVPGNMVVDVALFKSCLEAHGGHERSSSAEADWCRIHSLRPMPGAQK